MFPLVDLKITPQEVLKRLLKLDPSKTPGPDGLHPKVLKELSKEICAPLASVLQSSLEEGFIPQQWKDAIVSPIFKKGKHSDRGNYRPVSLTSSLQTHGRYHPGPCSDTPE